MKKTILTVAACVLMFSAGSFGLSAQNMEEEAALTLDDKRIKVSVKNDELNVKVYRVEAGDTIVYKQIYEGIFTDDKSYERYNVMQDITVPFLKYTKSGRSEKKKKRQSMSAHWAGFGFGFTNVSDSRLAINGVDGVFIVPERSHEWTFNIAENIIPIIGSWLGVTTGLGINRRNYALDYNSRMTAPGSYTQVCSAPQGIVYNKSKLRLFHLSIPALIEIQPLAGSRKNDLYFAAGVVGSLKLGGSYITKYRDENGTKEKNVERKGMNARLITMDFIAKAGCKDISIYAKYSPLGIFRPSRGPEVHPVSLGLMLEF